jgi:hypothetical protein
MAVVSVAAAVLGCGRTDLDPPGSANRCGHPASTCASGQAAVAALLDAAPVFPAGVEPNAMAVGDLDGDGAQDVVTASRHADELSVVLGNGDGTFQPPVVLQAGTGEIGLFLRALSAVVAVDVNEDGKLDLAVANRQTGNVAVHVGRGDGTFEPPRVSFAAGSPFAIAVGDLNGDRKLDLAVANLDSASAHLLLGNGDGTFRSSSILAVDEHPWWVALEDVNGDGKLDLLTVNQFWGSLNVLLGDGPAELRSAWSLPIGRISAISAPVSAALGDLDGDGRIDLAVAIDTYDWRLSDHVLVLLGNGDGTFRTGPSIATGGRGASSVAIDDVDADGVVDIVTANADTGDVTVLLGLGRGEFRSVGNFAVAGGTSSMALVDVNGDCRLDAVVASAAGLHVLLGGEGAVLAGGRTFGIMRLDSYSLALADLDRDGHLDLATANHGTDDISVLAGQGDGTFRAAHTFSAGEEPHSLVAGHVNDDGHVDLAVTNGSPGQVLALLGNGDGTLQSPRAFDTGMLPSAVVIADADGDHHRDLVVAHGSLNEVRVLLGDGQGAFQPARRLAVGDGPASVAAGDLNRDGRVDLVTGDVRAGQVSVLLGTGAGAFAAAQSYAVGKEPRAVTLADLDHDGNLDLAATKREPDGVKVLLGDGAGGFPRSVEVALDGPPRALAVGDLDGDGHPDLAAASHRSDWVSLVNILPGDGDGTFAAGWRFFVNRTAALRLGDLNGDGRLDLIAAHDTAGDVTVLLGTDRLRCR